MPEPIDLDAELRKWSRALPKWQQYALQLLDAHDSLTPEQEGRVFQFLLAESGLTDWPERFSGFELGYHGATGEPEGASPSRIRKMQNLSGINALSEGQCLEFGDGLTVVFGLNGSGKSGYARVLAEACGESRAGVRVLRNVFAEPSTVPTQSAELVLVEDDGSDSAPIRWHPGVPVDRLRGMRFLDSRTIGHFLGSASPMGMGPRVLGSFGRLSQLMDTGLNRRLAEYIDERHKGNPWLTDFDSSTTAGAYMRDLSARSDLGELARLGALSPEESAELVGTRGSLAECEADLADLDGRSAALSADLKSVHELAASLPDLRRDLDDGREGSVRAAALELSARTERVAGAAVEKFEAELLPGTGSPSWRHFIQAARGYADAVERGRTDTYPSDGDICLFCRQPLGEQATTLIEQYWRFLTESDATALKAAQAESKSLRQSLAALDPTLVGEGKETRAVLRRRAPDLLTALVCHTADLERRRVGMIAVLDGDAEGHVPALPADAEPNLAALAKRLQDDLAKLDRDALTARRAQLTEQVRELTDRANLGRIVEDVRAHVTRLREADRAAGIELDTEPITKKHGDLYAAVVSDPYREHFAATSRRLGYELPVAPRFTGQKGTRQRRLQLVHAEYGAVGVKESVPQVLSEGEQRLAAIADFLTEAAMLRGTVTLVLDDPVNSLDHHWREALADRLAEEAGARQVVVFTHDLVFAERLCMAGERRGVAIQRPEIAAYRPTVGLVVPVSSVTSERDYVTPGCIASELAELRQLAESLPHPSLLRARLERAFGVVRRFCEAFMCHRLLNGIARRFDPQVYMHNYTGVVWDPSIAARLVELEDDASRYIDGHLHADASGPAHISRLEGYLRRAEEIASLRNEARRAPPQPPPCPH